MPAPQSDRRYFLKIRAKLAIFGFAALSRNRAGRLSALPPLNEDGAKRRPCQRLLGDAPAIQRPAVQPLQAMALEEIAGGGGHRTVFAHRCAGCEQGAVQVGGGAEGEVSTKRPTKG